MHVYFFLYSFWVYFVISATTIWWNKAVYKIFPPVYLKPLPWRGSYWNWVSALRVKKKLEWCSTGPRKKFDDIFIHLHTIHEREGRTDRRTDRHRPTAKTVLTHSVARWKAYRRREIRTEKQAEIRESAKRRQTANDSEQSVRLPSGQSCRSSYW